MFIVDFIKSYFESKKRMKRLDDFAKSLGTTSTLPNVIVDAEFLERLSSVDDDSVDWVEVDIKNFSLTPGGKYIIEGEHSGEQFRKEVLQPILDSGNNIIVNLDAALGFTSSFLEEAFGGLVRHYVNVGIDISDRVRIESPSRPTRAEKALCYFDAELDKAGL